MASNKELTDSNKKKRYESKQPVLVLDLIKSILERLSFVDFHEARRVSPLWYLASKSCMITNLSNPWIILFPNDNDDSCKLFEPLHHKTYIVKDFGFDFASSSCLATSGSWLLMLDYGNCLHLLNLFTRERISLPSFESVEGWEMILKRRLNEENIPDFGDRTSNAVLYVDEKNKDYLVVYNVSTFFAYHKKGRDGWKVFQPLENQGCVNMVFKESKLYVLSEMRNVTVFDFSFSCGDSPIQCAIFPSPPWNALHYFNNLAVTLSGQVLIIAGEVDNISSCFFVYKMDPESSEWKLIMCIGDEALILDLGVTVAAKDGYMKNCIYYGNDKRHRYSGTSLLNKNSRICVYHISTNKIVQVFNHLTVSSPILFKDARWFSPIQGGKWLL